MVVVICKYWHNAIIGQVVPVVCVVLYLPVVCCYKQTFVNPIEGHGSLPDCCEIAVIHCDAR